MSSLADHEAELVAPHPGGAYKFDSREFPWWLAGLLAIIGAMVVAILFSDEYREAFTQIFPVPLGLMQGIAMTFYLTLGSFFVATFMGLFIGLARVSNKTTVSNLAALYIEFIRGIPMLVFIFAVALVLVPDFADLINQPSRAIPMAVRGGIALSLFYAAFIAEVFRAGIQSVPRDQSQAGTALGLTDRQVMRKIVLPQAVRNMLPALGNDLIALMKDTSLVSVLAVRELTQMARLYSGSSFRFRESFFVLMVIYVVLTLGLSLMLRWYERRIAIPGY
ncbi:MAG: amino acid ABC transporter permease [Acidimicrobiia bacterium]